MVKIEGAMIVGESASGMESVVLRRRDSMTEPDEASIGA